MRLSVPWRRALVLCLIWAGRVSGQESPERPSLERTDARPFELVLQAPPQCPDARAFRDTVARLASVGPETPGRLVAHVAIEFVGQARWSLTMQTEQNGLRGERTLEGPSCRAVADAAALTLALMLNPEAQQQSNVASPFRAARRRVRPRAIPRPLPQQATEHLALAGTAQIGLHVGALPRLGPDISLGITGGVGRGSVWLLGSFAPQQEKLVEANRGGRLWMLAGTALGCWQLARGSPSLGPCFGMAFNLIRGRGLGVSRRRYGTIYWVSPTAGLLADVPLGSWVAFRTAALGQAALARPTTYLEGIGPVHRPSRAEARVLAGLLIGPR